MEKKNQLSKRISTLIAFIAILSVMLLVGFTSIFAQQEIAKADNGHSPNSNSVQVITDTSSGFIGDQVSSPRWLTYEPRIGWTQQENYSSLQYSDLRLNYPNSGGTVTVNSGYINEERWAFNAQDSTGTHRLAPVNGVLEGNNIFASGATTVTIKNIAALVGTCKYTNDTMKMKDMTSALSIAGNKTAIGNGKVLYRSTNSNSFGAWSVTNLNESVSLRFTEAHVQIAIVYEVKETGRVFLDKDIYYRICGIYRFDIV